MDNQLNSHPWCYEGSAVEWAIGFIDLIKDCADREDYEAAKATKDSITEFLNKLGAEIPHDAQFKFDTP